MSTYPETKALAEAAYASAGAKTHAEFCNTIMQGAIGLRTFRYWLKGERPAEALAQLVLREVAAGWRPTPQSPAQ